MADKNSNTTNGTVSNPEKKNTENNKILGNKNIKIVFPIPKNERGQEFSNLDEIMAHVSGESTGNYLLGRNGMWHSGIHITNATTPWCALSGNAITEKASFPIPYKGQQAIRCMADGEIVAYRMNKDYLPLGWKNGNLNLSGSFVLVRHYIQPGETQKSGLHFYTLYMHLAPYSAYQANPSWITQDKLPTYSPEWKAVAGTNTYKDQNKLDALPKGSIVSWDKHDSQRQLKAVNGRLYGLVTIEKIAGTSKLNVGDQCWTLVDNNNILPEIEPSWWQQLVSPAKEMMQFDKVVSLTTPTTIKAGDSIGHMGFYQAPKEQGIDSRYQVHIECFSADDNLPQFLQNPEKIGHDKPQYLKCLPDLMLWDKQGDDFIKTERVVEWEKIFKLSELKTEKGKDNKEFYLLPEYLGAIPKITLNELNETDKKKLQESAFGALGKKTNELGAMGHQDQLIKENIAQYSKFLSQCDLAELGFKALVANADAFDHLNGHVQPQVEFISSVYENIKAEITGSSVPQKGIIAHNYQRLINKIKSDKQETYSPEEYRRAFHNPMFSHIVNKTIVKHPSDWYYKKSDSVWQKFLNILSEEAPLWRSYSEEFLDSMVWMQDVTNEKIGPEVWHMHPLVFLSAIKTDYECVKLIWGKTVSEKLGNTKGCEFRRKILRICSELWGEEKKYDYANVLMACIAAETSRTFSSSVIKLLPYTDSSGKTKKRYQGVPRENIISDPSIAKNNAVGLIQFTGEAITQINNINNKRYTKQDLALMDELEQLDVVKLYFLCNKLILNRVKSPEDIYLYIFCPEAVGKDNDYIMYSVEKDKLSGKNFYEANKSIDTKDGNSDGKITRNELLVRLNRLISEGQQLINNCTCFAEQDNTIKIKEPSGVHWVSRFPTSVDVNDLTPDFSSSVTRFIQAIRDAGGNVRISATFRPPERAYLMHYAYAISRENFDPSKVPEKEGVNIDWTHNGDLASAKKAAQQMDRAYVIKYKPSLTSRHTQRRAIDMTITNIIGKSLINGSGANVPIKNLKNLFDAGASFGVIKLVVDEPHWSDDGA
ncbi:hypothetical protein P2E05_13620 [Providencia stuartii]|uniref:hypothetical protein n=1 Tax=Providencia stuartii TaxID=588 RepID=UPI0023E12174|nr:hypothetical protein [Providencia stuartii]ELR5143086.1 hypothetical protein [Providencia stuartii]WER21134.1 hypothetical protein P2E04_13615 [Providencia stuartii]WER25254.1 hypothetical protein P2E05_13620 [Providencia stuartii]WER29344.1 hypothetical protein P2E06_13620 [Providencia stuartii]